MLRAVALLFTCQLAGEVILRGLQVPIPGPVLGLVLRRLDPQARAREAAVWPSPRRWAKLVGT